MPEPILNPNALREPQTRRLLIIIGIALLALLVVAAVWQSSGTRGARRDLASASDRVADKQREVEDARRALDQKLSELRAMRAEADAKATKLGGAVEQEVGATANDAGLDPAAQYYVRDREGRFVPVRRP